MQKKNIISELEKLQNLVEKYSERYKKQEWIRRATVGIILIPIWVGSVTRVFQLVHTLEHIFYTSLFLTVLGFFLIVIVNEVIAMKEDMSILIFNKKYHRYQGFNKNLGYLKEDIMANKEYEKGITDTVKKYYQQR